MENCSLESYAPIETALNEAGLVVEEIVKQSEKTVITVRRQIPPNERLRVERQSGKKLSERENSKFIG